MPATLHKLNDRGHAGFANVTLASGERVFLSLAVNGLRVHRLHLGGLVPGRTLMACDAPTLERAVRNLARAGGLPPLPQAFRMEAVLDSALAMLTPRPGLAGVVHVGGGDGDDDALPDRPVAVLARLALAARDADDLVRRIGRAANTA